MITSLNRKSAGFSMIEVMVALLVIVIGVLGLAGLQSKTIPYTQDSAQRNTAIMLADDLVDLMRSSNYDSSRSIKDFQKAPGADFPAAANACIPTPSSISNRLGCWASQAIKVLPGASDLVKTGFYVCWSVTPGDVTSNSCSGSTAGKEIEIRLSWTVVKGGDCMDGNAQNTTCAYTIRTRL
jgi:type IV pilus assembly protein PilV